MIDVNIDLNIGDKIELVKIYDEEEQTYPSQILDITEEGNFIIGGPIHKSKLVLMHIGENVKIGYIIENKGRYIFNGKILNREYKRVYKLEVQKTSKIKRYQRRKYYRFDISIPVTKKNIFKEKDNENILIEKCRTKDISGSGMKLYSNFQHSVGDIILCEFNLDDCFISTKGKVIRIEDVDAFEYNYSLGVDFVEIDENDKDNIIKFIFSKERLLRKKGLI